jgi:S-(hydroxymethyl)glutathione dehydrogenase/alcohol dehydrogenase
MAAAGGMLDGSTRLTLDGQPLRQMAMCGTFGNYAIVPEISLVKIDDDVDLRFAALIGCGVLTGVGAALNTANIRQGDTVAVVGCGGVGLNVIQGAKIAGAEKIIAVDMFESKLKMAEQFGATDLVKADEGDAVTNVVGLTPNGRGADVSFEVIGLGPTIEQTINMTRNGGEAILVGVPRMDVMLNLNAAFTFLYLAKTVKGCWYGSSNVREDIPKLIELYKGGKLMLEELVSREIGVDGVNEAFTAMQSGEVARSLITHSH